MPKYQDNHLKTFISLAQKAGSGVGKSFHQSGVLGPLVQLLGKNCTVNDVLEKLKELVTTNDNTYANKANKYKKAIYHLELTFPIPAINRIANPTPNSHAIRFEKGGEEPKVKEWQKGNDDPSTWIVKKVDFALPSKIESLSYTVEDFILHNPGTGVIIIHLQDYQDPMDIKYDGFRAVDHINTVLYVARQTNSPICALRVKDADAVCDALKFEYNQFTSKIDPLYGRHSGFHVKEFRDFVEGKNDIVVIGYEADMCVHQNMFGGGELHQRTEKEKDDKIIPHPVSALLTHTNVITSRPLLVTPGTIQRVEYGVLHNT